MNAELNEKIEQLLNQLEMTEEEKAHFYMSTVQFVTRELETLISEILTDEDLQHLEQIDDEKEANAYIDAQVKNKMGQSTQDISDEILRELLERVQIEGIKELLENLPTPTAPTPGVEH